MKNKYIVILILLLFQFSCTEIIDPDMSGRQVVLLAPGDSLSACNGRQLFWWSAVDFAESYNLQIVSPDFQYVERLILDTIVEAHKIEFLLSPGNYQWRVASLNNNNSTEYATRTLTIENMDGLSSVALFHIEPSDTAYTNTKGQHFFWEADKRIKQYNFNLYYLGQRVVSKELSENTTEEQLIWGDGVYKWSVQGISCDSSSSISWSSFYLDTKSPEAPILLNPENFFETTDSVVLFKWARGTEETKMKLSDSLFVYADSTLKEILISKKSDTTSYQDTLHANREYYWRVRTIDEAGNLSNYSKVWRFRISPER